MSLRPPPMTPKPQVRDNEQQPPHLTLEVDSATDDDERKTPNESRGQQRSRSAPVRTKQRRRAHSSNARFDTASSRPIASSKEHSPLTPVPDPEKNVKRVAAHEYAKSSFFHGTFTSSHGATMVRFPTPRLSFAAPRVQPGGEMEAMQLEGNASMASIPQATFNAYKTKPTVILVDSSTVGGRPRVFFDEQGRLQTPPMLTTMTPMSNTSVPTYGTLNPSPIGHVSPRLDDMLPSTLPPGGTFTMGVHQAQVEVAHETVSWTDAAKELIPLSIPSFITMALTYGLTAIPLGFIGSHIGEEKLTGASIAVFIISIVAQYPIFGLTFALDTLASHEYGRNPNSDVLGVLLQRGIIVNLAFCVPVCLFLVFWSQSVLTPIYGVVLATIASDFLRFLPLFMFPLVVFVAFSKFCANQMLPQIPTIAMTCGLIVTPIAQRSLIHLGVEGSMLGMAVASWTQLLVIVALTFFNKQTRLTLGTLRIADALDWDDVTAYLKLALPSAVFVAAEASAFDMSVLLAAKLGSAEGAAWSAIINCLLPFISVAGGLSTAACAKVGASLGAGYPEDAKRYAFTAVGLATFAAFINSAIVMSSYNLLLDLFGTEGSAVTVAYSFLWLIPFLHVSDALQFAFQGVFSGCGQNHKGAIILLCSLWAIGFPASLLLAFVHDFGAPGIVGGLTIGLFVESPCLIYTAYNMDWKKLSEDAQAEAMEDEEEEEEEEELEYREVKGKNDPARLA
jgi:multidrug resistance protein, MATE family